MTARTCETCGHGHVIEHAAWQRAQLRCFRDRTFVSGEIARHENVGASVQFERDSLPEPHRAPGDKCSVEGRHWTARDGVA